MTDSEIDRLVGLCNRRWARAAISLFGDIDFPSRLFHPVHTALTVLASPLLQKLTDRLNGRSNDSIDRDLVELELDVDRIIDGTWT